MKNNYEEYSIRWYPQDLVSNKNYSEDKILSSSLHQDLQSFSRQISYLSALHTNGKMSTSTVCDRINNLWESLDSFNN